MKRRFPEAMHVERSVNMTESGTLFVVATPIGNLGDITVRALDTLKTADWVAAEDTRHTSRLLTHYEIRARLISCHEHNESERIPRILDLLGRGDAVALVSNAGTPMVSDPGFRICRAAIDAGFRVVPLPGPSAAVCALTASGLPSDGFVFVGFPPKKAGRRTVFLAELAEESRTLVCYESPKRIQALLGEIQDILGDRKAVLCREMTKLHEEFIRGTVSRIREILAARESVKGECTLLIQGNPSDAPPPMDRIRLEMDTALRREGTTVSALSKTMARKYGIPKNDAYAEALAIKERIAHERQ